MGKQGRFYRVIFILAMVCMLTTACGKVFPLNSGSDNSPQAIQARGKLVAAVSVYPPFIYLDAKTQQLVGYDVDLAQAIANKIGVSLEIKEVQFTSLIPSVQNGQADLALGALYITSARKELADFSVPYLETGIVLVAKKPIQSTDRALDGKIVGVKTGGTSEKVANDLKNRHFNIVVKSYGDVEDYLRDLENDRIDVALNDRLNQLEYNKTHKNLVIGEERLSKDSLGIVVRKGNKGLLQVVDGVIVEMQNNGENKRLYNKWLEKSNL